MPEMSASLLDCPCPGGSGPMPPPAPGPTLRPHRPPPLPALAPPREVRHRKRERNGRASGGSERNRRQRPPPTPQPRRGGRSGGFCSSSASVRPPLCPARGCRACFHGPRRGRRRSQNAFRAGGVPGRPRRQMESRGGTRLLDASPAPGGCIWAFAQGLGWGWGLWGRSVKEVRE